MENNPINYGSKKKHRKLFFFLVLIVFVIGAFIFQSIKARSAQTSSGSATTKAYVKESRPINKTFTFPLTDTEGKKIGEFTYEVQKAELRNEIFIKGQRATSLPNREFLVVDLKLKNNLDSGLEINSRDYIRLSVNNSKQELLAPEIHNDPVEVQAVSTKFTRLGFTTNTSDKNLLLIIGEIGGKKQEIPLTF